MTGSTRTEVCGGCTHFRNDSRELESQLPGLATLSSADGATRGDDGLCARHDRFTGLSGFCGDFLPVRQSVKDRGLPRQPAGAV